MASLSIPGTSNETYAIYNDSTKAVITIYFGDTPPTLIPLDSQMYYLRIKRGFLLKESDKYMLADYPIEMTREEWSERVLHYRQELRNFPSTCDMYNPIFPTPPTEG